MFVNCHRWVQSGEKIDQIAIRVLELLLLQSLITLAITSDLLSVIMLEIYLILTAMFIVKKQVLTGVKK